LKSGLSSKTEMEYFTILKYFFGSDIKKGFKLKNKFYDFILLDKILIEFDGDYWHGLLKNKLNDMEKDRIALDEGYILYRVKESESKDIEHINKLFKLTKLVSNENKIT
jgi:very-short-patch-repair endonuclease